MHIWTPRYAVPNRPLGITPPSPPAEQQQKQRRAWQKEFRSYRGRVICPGSEQYEEAMTYLACPMPLTGVGGPTVSGGGGGGTSLPTANLIAQWKADSGVFSDAGTTPATNTGTVQQWNDSFSTANQSQATSGSRPQYLTGQQNGLPGVKFAGAKGMAASFTAMSNGTVFMVMNWHTDSSGQAQWGAGSAVSSSYVIDMLTLGAPSIFCRDHGNNTVVTGPAVGTWCILAFGTGNSGAGFFRKNAGSSTTTATGDLANQWVGCALGTTGTASWTFGEILIYSGILGTTDETAVRNYLNGRWAIF